MKKIYIALLLFMPFISKAQTITVNDLPYSGLAFTMGVDDAYSGPIPTFGLNQTWDFSTLVATDMDTVAFVSASSTPYFTTFLNSNLAAFDAASGSYAYYSGNGSGFYLDGLKNALFTFVYEPSQLFLPVPFTFGDNRNSTAVNQIDTTLTDTAGTFNFRFIHRIEALFKADGTGTLTTPAGTYTDVLRIKITETTYDSTYVDIGFGVYQPVPGAASASQAVHFRFFTALGAQANYIMGIEADSLGTTPVSSEYLADANLNVPSPIENKNFVAYPNPVKNELNFKNLTGNMDLIIFDSSGKEVLNSKNTVNNKVGVEGLSNGVYYYEIRHNGKSEKRKLCNTAIGIVTN